MIAAVWPLSVNFTGGVSVRQSGVIGHDRTSWRTRPWSLLPDSVSTVFDKLRQSGALNERKLRTYGAGIASCVQKGYKVPSALLPEKETRHPLSETEKKAYNLLKTQVEQKCTMLGIDPALIATSSELKEIVSANKRASLGRARRLLTGWRGHFLADIIPLINPSLLK